MYTCSVVTVASSLMPSTLIAFDAMVRKVRLCGSHYTLTKKDSE